jgi:VWFA-related protein
MKARATVALLLTVTALASQNAQVPKITVSTHLVQIGVIVHDHNGPVENLTKDDFVVLDHGKPQKISIFEIEGAESTPTPVAELPQNAFSNLPQYETDKPRSVTIVLLDNLNTLYGSAPQPYETSPYWIEDMALTNAKAHLVEFIKGLDPRDRVAIYGLSGSLHVLADFTSDRSQLLAILEKYDTRSLTNRETAEPGTIHMPNQPQDKMGPEFSRTQTKSEATLAGMMNANRAAVTMAALQSIVAHVANIPGRKNLVWLTGNLPFSGEGMAEILGPAQIAVYPVDGRGLETRLSMQSLEGVIDYDAPARGDFAPAQSPEPIGVDTMGELADLTGGQAAVNTNGLTQAIRNAVENSVATYTLGFYVDKDLLDGKFHELKVQVKRPGLTIRYPKGYLAAKDNPATEEERRSALAAAVHSPFEWSALPLTVTVHRVDQPAPHALKIAGSVGLKNLQLVQEGSVRTGVLQVYLVEQDVTGKVLNQIPNRLRLRLTEQQYQNYLASGIVFQQYIQPKPDSTMVRVIVQDASSSEIGSAIIPLAALK